MGVEALSGKCLGGFTLPPRLWLPGELFSLGARGVRAEGWRPRTARLIDRKPAPCGNNRGLARGVPLRSPKLLHLPRQCFPTRT